MGNAGDSRDSPGLPQAAGGSPRVSVVIRAYNEQNHLERLLTGIQRQSLGGMEVILVDSGSTDGTLAVARRYPVKVVSIAPEEFTFGRSLNLGIRHARAAHVVIASAHVYPVYPDWIERLLEPFEHARIGLTYGRQRGASTTRFSEQQIFAKLYPSVSAIPQPQAFCNNANAAIRRDLWARRPYDEELSGLEDLDWATWAVGEGYQVGYVAQAEVVHVHNETSAQVFNRYRREAIALKRQRPNEHFGLRDLLRLYVSNVVSDAWHALRQGQGVRVWSEIGWYRWLQFWGTYRGFAHRGPLTADLKRTFYYPRGLGAPEAESPRPVDPIDYGVTTSEG